MDETEISKQSKATVIDEKTLADLIKNSQIPTASIIGIPTINSATFALTQSDKYCYLSQLLKQEWVIPNKTISDSINKNNRENYIFINCTFEFETPGKLVLCNVYKDEYSDGSFKFRYDPVVADNLKRIPE